MIDVKEGFLHLRLPPCAERENNVFDEASGDIGAINRKHFPLPFFQNLSIGQMCFRSDIDLRATPVLFN